MSESERIIKNVNATMSMEGMPLTDEDKERLLLCLSRKKSFEATVDELINRYRKSV